MDKRGNHPEEPAPSPTWAGRAVKGAGLLGVVISLLFMAALPFGVLRWRSSVRSSISDAADLMSASGGGLRQAAGAVEDLGEILTTVVDSLESTSSSLEEVEAMSSTSYELLHDQIPQSLEDTETALKAAEAASGEIDSVLSALDAVSFLTGVEYDPNVPLDEAVAGVASSLDPIAESMLDISEALSNASDELGTTSESLMVLSGQLRPYEEQLGEVAVELEQLAGRMETASMRISLAGGKAYGWMLAGLVVVELLLLWIMLGQIAVYHVGDRVMIKAKDGGKAKNEQHQGKGGLDGGKGS